MVPRWLRSSEAVAPPAPSVEASPALAKRIALLQIGDFPRWIEQSLFTIERSLLDYERHPDPIHVEEALEAGRAVLALLEEFKRRTAG